MIKESKCLWIAYSWHISQQKVHLCIGTREVGGTDSALLSNLLYFPFDISQSATLPPDMGVVAPLGVSGLNGPYQGATSPLDVYKNQWHSYALRMDEEFERTLANLLLPQIFPINNDQEPLFQEEPIKDNYDFPKYIIIQGPAFPKLLGRIAYRHKVNSNGPHILFITFRRRFLTPNPIMTEAFNDIKKGIVQGPFPDLNKEALLRRYYLMVESEVDEIPLMIEFMQHDQQYPFDQNIVDDFFNDVLQLKFNLDGSISSPDKKSWVLHPDRNFSPALHQVAVPKILYDLNLETLRELYKKTSMSRLPPISMEKLIRKYQIKENRDRIATILRQAANAPGQQLGETINHCINQIESLEG